MNRRHAEPSLLERASVLVVDGDTVSMSILSQVLAGFGARNLHKAETALEGQRILETSDVDLVIVDPTTAGSGVRDFLSSLRRRMKAPNRFVPAIVLAGYSPQSMVVASRDSGANFIVTKPIAPSVLLSRILWLSRERRGFIDSANYCGPDRRFKFDGPPRGTAGRRESDAFVELGEATQPNLSQEVIDAMMKPRKVDI